MNSRSKYKTKQREILLSYFETAPGVHITAGDVCEYFRSRGAPIGQATVYRQLESLVDEGILCKCEKCGKLIHLHSDEMEDIRSHLLENHRFQLDPMRTVFYGLCAQCMATDR